MDRRGFLRALPGLFAVREISKHLDKIPVQKIDNLLLDKSLWGSMQDRQRVIRICRGIGGLELFKEAMRQEFDNQHINHKVVRMQYSLPTPV
jgi:hypothetical protein